MNIRFIKGKQSISIGFLLILLFIFFLIFIFKRHDPYQDILYNSFPYGYFVESNENKSLEKITYNNPAYDISFEMNSGFNYGADSYNTVQASDGSASKTSYRSRTSYVRVSFNHFDEIENYRKN